MKSVKPWAALVAACLFSSPCLAEQVGEVLGVKGTASLILGGTTTPVVVGTRIDSGAEIRTGRPGRLKLRFIDGSVLVISDGSVLKVEKYALSGSQRDASFVLDIGLISQTVVPASAGSWTVRTPTAVTAVRGTEYMVEVTSDQATAVNVQSGKVAVEPSHASKQARRKRGLVLEYEGLTVLLDQPDLGTTCSADGLCGSSKTWDPERIRHMKDRLSGV